MGVGNVVEMLDADSVGVNALLMGIASELDIDLAFTTEYSVKTKGSVRELVRASEMMYLAKTKKQTPKDLGIDLLILKDKRKVKDILPEVDGNFKFTEVGKTPIKQLEEGCFRIYLDKGKIHVIYYMDDIQIGFTGTDAKDLYKTIANHPEIKISTEHAAYLGKELGKAEIALKLNKNYIQDTELF
jgi:dihydropteroate synthase-like protein